MRLVSFILFICGFFNDVLVAQTILRLMINKLKKKYYGRKQTGLIIGSILTLS
jgi:hypothetical protein